jgi:cell division protein FtsB
VKVLSLILTALIILLQYPLWLGKGSWLKVWEVDQQVVAQYETNQKLKTRNAALDAEVRDLKQGYEAIEERARSELGMIKEDEVFFYITEGHERSPLEQAGQEDGKL